MSNMPNNLQESIKTCDIQRIEPDKLTNVKTDEPWEKFSNWIHCICVVTFDLELGQAIENIYPSHISLSKAECMNLCYLAFPDSNSGCMGDTYFIIRMQQNSANAFLNKEHLIYNEKCPSSLEAEAGYFWGYVYFRQVKDISLPRGYFQKSVVILSRLPFNNLFLKLSSLIAPEFFDNGSLSLEAVCYSINRWPSPTPGQTLNLPLLGTVFQVHIPTQSSIASSTLLTQNELNNGHKDGALVLPSVSELNLFEILLPVLSHIHLLWELVLISEPIVIMATSPSNCSALVIALTRIIAPLKFCAEHRPYFTIHDKEFKEFTSKARGPPPVMLGVTNPYFAKTFHHWPHTIKLVDNIVTNSYKYKLKKNGNAKILDTNPGVYTSYKPFLQKDKAIIKKLLLGIHTKRPLEVQSAILRRHLLELTQSFMIPLERYIASLMPLQKNISPFKATPLPLPFNPDDFLATLELSGPQLTSGIKGDWLGLYRRFFRSPNFSGWFNMRYRELASKLQTLQLQALSDANLKLWVQGKPEVEVVDMVLKIKHKLNFSRDNKLPVTEETREQLVQRLQDILCTLPDDLKHILELT